MWNKYSCPAASPALPYMFRLRLFLITRNKKPQQKEKYQHIRGFAETHIINNYSCDPVVLVVTLLDCHRSRACKETPTVSNLFCKSEMTVGFFHVSQIKDVNHHTLLIQVVVIDTCTANAGELLLPGFWLRWVTCLQHNKPSAEGEYKVGRRQTRQDGGK